MVVACGTKRHLAPGTDTNQCYAAVLEVMNVGTVVKADMMRRQLASRPMAATSYFETFRVCQAEAKLIT